MILDGLKDHLVPHLAEKKIAKEIWDNLNNLFESNNENRNMTLRDMLHNSNMNKDEGVASYLTQVPQVKDELVVVGDIVSDS